MLSVFGFLIILAPLVVVHEFGHYIFARIFGVKAETFSIGFGPRLWAKQLGETELRVSIIPLGGYVKLLGEDRDAPLKEDEARRALHRQAGYKRFFIFFGGPLFNFVFAVFLFMSVLAIGEPQPANIIGRVVQGSAPAAAGLQSGDEVLSVMNTPVKRFDQILSIIHDHPASAMDFEVRHSGASAPVHVTVTSSSEKGYSIYGESISVGVINGISPMGRGQEAGVSNSATVAYGAGIRTGDRIVEVNGAPIRGWEDLERIYSDLPTGAKLTLRVQKPSGTEEKNIELTKSSKAPALTMAEVWGLHSSELFVDKTIENSPASRSGVRSGDRLIGVGGVGDATVQSFMDLREAVQDSGEKTGKVILRFEHEGKLVSQELIPTQTKGKDAEMKTTIQYTVGVVPMVSLAEPVTVIERIWNPFVLVYKGAERMITFSWRNLVSIAKMLTGGVSVGTLGGPILIGKIAGESLSHGLVTFLTTMAILSIGLGVLNLLPVPILDGGHIVLLFLESLRGRPLTMRQMEIIQGVGLVLILALMSVVMKNDITRLVSF